MSLQTNMESKGWNYRLLSCILQLFSKKQLLAKQFHSPSQPTVRQWKPCLNSIRFMKHSSTCLFWSPKAWNPFAQSFQFEHRNAAAANPRRAQHCARATHENEREAGPVNHTGDARTQNDINACAQYWKNTLDQNPQSAVIEFISNWIVLSTVHPSRPMRTPRSNTVSFLQTNHVRENNWISAS